MSGWRLVVIQNIGSNLYMCSAGCVDTVLLQLCIGFYLAISL